MGRKGMHRLGAAILAIGALLGMLGVAFAPPPDQHVQAASTPQWSWIIGMVLIGSLLAVLAFPAVHDQQAEPAGALGLLGFACVMLTLMLFGVMLSGINLLVLPWMVTLGIPSAQLQAGPPTLFPFFVIGTVIALVGAVLYGLATLRARVLAPWNAWVLMAAGVLHLLPFVAPALPGMAANLAPIAFYLALVLYGLDARFAVG